MSEFRRTITQAEIDNTALKKRASDMLNRIKGHTSSVAVDARKWIEATLKKIEENEAAFPDARDERELLALKQKVDIIKATDEAKIKDLMRLAKAEQGRGGARRKSKMNRRTRRRTRKQLGRGRRKSGAKKRKSPKRKSPKKNTGQKSRQSAAKKAVKELMKACQKAEDDNGPDGINAMGNRFNCGEDISPKMQTALDGADAKQANRALKEVKSKTAAYKRAVRTGNIDEIF